MRPRCAAFTCRATSPRSRRASAPSCRPTAVGTASSARPASALLTEILKNELGFEGFLISDYNAIDQIAKDYKEAIGISINAGMDMVMVPARYREYFTDLKALVQRRQGADVAHRRCGTAHPARQVRHGPDGSQALASWPTASCRRPSARPSIAPWRARRCANRWCCSRTTPRRCRSPRTAARIHVAGKNADDIGNQCGGWTIDWQGKSGDVTTGGTTILAAIKSTVSKDTKVTFSKDGSGAAGATVGVVVIGEKPYAEMQGDRADLALAPEDIAAVQDDEGRGHSGGGRCSSPDAR